ncbi:MAG: type II toxin-antitoxin system VapC family toxin [Thaumarchaeota archaeon]|nr:type II toxin-antitoxin system VapC family toxin [Nitrososphaerota archaeon]
MLESYVVDASVVAKWFNTGEAYEKEARNLRDAWISGKLHLRAPSMLPFEVANSIWKNPNISTKVARSLVRLVIRLSPDLMNPREEDSEQAMLLARRTKLTFYDSIYLTLAKSLSSILVTADDEQLSASNGYTKAVHIASIKKLER